MPGLSNGQLSPAGVALGFAPGAGGQLVQQRDDQVEEEKRKKRLGIDSASPALLQLFNMQGMGRVAA